MKFSPAVVNSFVISALVSSTQATSLRGANKRFLEQESQPSNPMIPMDTVNTIINAMNAADVGNETTPVLQSGAKAAKYSIQNDNDQLLQGFSIGVGGTGASPYEDIFPCDDENNDGFDKSACIEQVTSPDGSNTDYESTLTDKHSRDEFMSTMVSAEGGTVGFHMSSSADYMTSSTMSSTGISYTIGGSMVNYEKRVRNYSKLKLKDFAKDMLMNDPATFISNYGLDYVHSITFGGNFLGSYELNAQSSSGQTQLDAQASMKYSEGIFSVGGSVAFSSDVSTMDSSVNVKSNWKALPDPGIVRTPISSPLDLANVYGNWSSTCLDSPAPIFLYVNGWIASDDVAEIVFSPDFPQDFVSVFSSTGGTISPQTIESASDERVNTELLLKSIDTYLQWPGVVKDKESDLYKSLKKLGDDCRTYYTWYTSEFDDGSMYQLQNELLGLPPTEGEEINPFDSWLYYSQDGGLLDQFEAIEPELQKLSPTCDINRADEVYVGCGYVYQDATNCATECAEYYPDDPDTCYNNKLPFIPKEGDSNKDGLGACDIQRNQKVYSGCGYIYQSLDNCYDECKQYAGEGNTQCSLTMGFIPKE